MGVRNALFYILHFTDYFKIVKFKIVKKIKEVIKLVLEFGLKREELEVLNHLVAIKRGQLERELESKAALVLGGSSCRLKDLEFLQNYLWDRLKLSEENKKGAVQLKVQLKKKEIKWIIIFAREELGQLIRSNANRYGPLKLGEFENLIKFLEEQIKERRIVSP